VSDAGRFRSKPGGDEVPRPKIDPTSQLIEDLQALAADSASIVANGRASFLSSDGTIYRHAADGILVKVQELCDRFPASFRADRPDVPWQAIRGTRNRIGHNYRATDYSIIWQTLEHGLPDLIRSIKAE
jgi:uncharacterized protein with HEPN domain